MGFWDIFSWTKTKEQQVDKTKRSRRSPTPIDWTDSLQVNTELTKGLYHNTYPGIKLGGVFAFNIIAVPVSFMGFPIPRSASEAVQDQLDLIVESMTDEMKAIHIQSHREGTIWIWPKYANNKLIWEFIPDDAVTDIIRDISTGEVIKVITKEDIILSVSEGKTAKITRKRVFTKTRFTLEYTGEVPVGLRGRVTRNPAHVLPIAFANNADGGISRGHSDYTRVLPDIKNYHDIDLAESSILAKFSPKMIVDNVKDVEEYAKTQGYTGAADLFENIELGKIDIVINQDEEKTSFVIPERATESLRKKLQQIYHKILEGTGLPEIVLGLNASGNDSSVEQQMATLMAYVEAKREQKNRPYTELFRASLELLLMQSSDLTIEWNQLDAVSEQVRSEIFKNFSEGMSAIIGKAGMTKEQLFKMWRKNYPGISEDTFEEFETGITNMLGHTVASESTLDQLLISQGLPGTTSNM
jgi:hypothetical protein